MHVTTVQTHLTYDVQAESHFKLAIAARHGGGQRLLAESIDVACTSGRDVRVTYAADHLGNRSCRFDAGPGRLDVRYAVRGIAAAPVARESLREYRVTELPDDVLPWLLPSRYCESDRLAQQAYALFGKLPPGVARVEAIVEWVRANVQYEVGASCAFTSAHDVLERGRGVCRDFAHLCIAFCRALNLPARLAVGYVRFDDPPQDFHAQIEVWLGRWAPFDPTGLADPDALLKVAIGRDAKDCAFGTLFGPVLLRAMNVSISDTDVHSGRTWVGDDSKPVLALAA